MLMFAGKVHDLRHFGLSNLIRVDPALPYPVMVDVEHDARSRFPILVEEALKYVNDKFHRRVVIIQQQNAVKVRPLRLRTCFRDDSASRPHLVASPSAVVIAEPRREVGALRQKSG
jgi:hypothetical protein